jgi:hypothetical protein
MRNVDYFTIGICALAAALCYIDNPLSSFMFCISSIIGLVDSINKRVLPAALINGIFLTLNLAFSIQTILNK